jgi:uncharacterized protein (DUF58 family)
MGGNSRLSRFLSFFAQNQNLIVVLVLTAAAWVLALASGFWFFLRLAYVLSALIPLSYLWSWSNLRGLKVTVVREPQRVQVGQKVEGRVRVRSRSILPKLWLEIEDPSDLPGPNPRTVVSLTARGFRTWRMITPCRRRGLYTLGPLVIRSGDPFGLFRMKRAFGPHHSLVVYPLPEAIPQFWAPPADLPGENRQRRRTPHVTPSAASVRDYGPGDSFGRIHWPSTARLGRLMVKTFDLEPTSDVWVMLDLHRDVQAGSGDDSTEEYGVHIACSAANHFLGAHQPAGYIAYGSDLTVLPPDRGHQHFARILEALALAKGEGQTPLADLLNQEGRRFGRHSTLLAITPSTDEAWVHSLQGLVARGVKVAVVLLEASTFGARGGALLAFSTLAAGDIPTYLVRRGDDLATALGPAALASAYSRAAAFVQVHRGGS